MFKKSQNEIEDHLLLKQYLIKNHFYQNLYIYIHTYIKYILWQRHQRGREKKQNTNKTYALLKKLYLQMKYSNLQMKNTSVASLLHEEGKYIIVISIIEFGEGNINNCHCQMKEIEGSLWTRNESISAYKGNE